MIITKDEAKVTRNANSNVTKKVEAIVAIITKDLVKDKGEASGVSYSDLETEFPGIVCFNSAIRQKVQDALGAGYVVRGKDTRKDAPKYIQTITAVPVK